MMGDTAVTLDGLARNEGTVLTRQHLAVYRDGEGELHAVSNVCTHRGCDVAWSDGDKVWACPCHGSRFAPTGAVLNGPAMRPLPSADLPK